jgi:ABC-type nitrate/sulfonate/bicarbonate transport system permease component
MKKYIISSFLRKNSDYLYGVIIIFSVMIVLEIFLALFYPNHRYIIRPSIVFMQYQKAINEGLLNAMLATVLRTLLGFFIASIIGVIMGVLIGKIKILHRIFQPIIDLFRPLPSSAIVPAAAMIIGLNQLSYIFVIVFGGVWPILISTSESVKNVDKNALAAINQLGLNPYEMLKYFILPEAISEIMAGLKISLSVCLILAVTAEIIMGFTEGIGQYLRNVESGGDYALMYFTIIMIAFVGLFLNTLLSFAEHHINWINCKYD